ncbi:hypothetical protein [Yoonia sp. SS1-5]|uniref:Ribbon-helix-helix protein, CopG family n=1 Tax=Yoonia rhodophyticola TaxID=3137370 RepID=A0AAN0MDA9_9RHOB
MKQITLGLPPELVDALDHLCGRNEDAIGDVLRAALRKDLRNRAKARADRLGVQLAPLREDVSRDLADAADWDDLKARLWAKGYSLARRGGGLSIYDRSGNHLCNGADLGHSYARLMRRFGQPIAPRGVMSAMSMTAVPCATVPTAQQRRAIDPHTGLGTRTMYLADSDQASRARAS